MANLKPLAIVGGQIKELPLTDVVHVGAILLDGTGAINFGSTSDFIRNSSGLEIQSANAIRFLTTGVTTFRIAANASANQYINIVPDVSNGPRIVATDATGGGAGANANLYLSAGVGTGAVYLYTNGMGRCGLRVDNGSSGGNFITAAPSSTNATLGTNAGGIQISPSSGRVGVNIAPVTNVGFYSYLGGTTGATPEYSSYHQLTAYQATGAQMRVGCAGTVSTTTGYTGSGDLVGSLGTYAQVVSGLTVGRGIGVRGVAYVNTDLTGTVSQLVGVIGLVANYGTASVTYAFDFAAENTVAIGSTLTANYWAGMTAGTNKYAFYGAGSAASFFGGDVTAGGASANQIKLTGGASGSAATISAIGEADTYLALTCKGNGNVYLSRDRSGTFDWIATFRAPYNTASANGFVFNSDISGNSPVIFATGTDTDVGMRLLTKGAGSISIETDSGSPQMEILHVASANRKLKVRGGRSTVGSNTRIEASAGQLTLGIGSAMSTSATEGFICIPTCAGAPTGTPVDAGAGNLPLIYDTTNNKLYAYNGAWKSSAAFT